MTKGKINLVSVVERVGPVKAQEYLDLCLVNRRYRQTWVDQLARMISDGDWKLTHQGIAFNCDGTLKDGRHRLLAIIKSGMTVPIMVTRGLPDDAMEVIDTGRPRTDADAMQIQGIDVDHHAVAIAKRMREGITNNVERRMTRPETLRFVATHLEAIRFAMKGGKAGMGHASVRAPIARAWYTADRARLQQFAICLSSGVMEDKGDLAAITLRNALLRARGNNLGALDRHVIYRKTEAALSAFLARRLITRVYETDRELFPLPEESRS